MAKHHPDLIFCRKQPGVGKRYNNYMREMNCFKTFDILLITLLPN